MWHSDRINMTILTHHMDYMYFTLHQQWYKTLKGDKYLYTLYVQYTCTKSYVQLEYYKNLINNNNLVKNIWNAPKGLNWSSSIYAKKNLKQWHNQKNANSYKIVIRWVQDKDQVHLLMKYAPSSLKFLI